MTIGQTAYINGMLMTNILTSCKVIDPFMIPARVLNWKLQEALRHCLITLRNIIFVLVSLCIPVKTARNLVGKMAGKCINIGNIILGYEISNILFNIVIIDLPIAQICKFRVSTGYKIAAACIFLLGGL